MDAKIVGFFILLCEHLVLSSVLSLGLRQAMEDRSRKLSDEPITPTGSQACSGQWA